MLAIFSYWLQSLSFFRPQFLWHAIKQLFAHMVYATVWTCKLFYPLILCDIIIHIIFGDLLARFAVASAEHAADNTLFLVLQFARSTIWFVLAAAFFLLACKKSMVPARTYIKTNFLRYILLLIGMSFVFLVVLLVLASFGITKIPFFQGNAAVVFKAIQFFFVFYWLEQTPGFGKIPTTLERTANFILYNVFLIAFFIGIFFLLDYLTGFIAAPFVPPTAKITNFLVKENIHIIAFHQGQPKMVILSLLAKYTVALIENMWICMLFILFRSRKYKFFYTSLFEENQ